MREAHRPTQKQEAVFNIGSRAFLWAYQVFLCQTMTVCCKRCRNKIAWKNCTKYIKYYLLKARLHALNNKQHKKKKWFFFCWF